MDRPRRRRNVRPRLMLTGFLPATLAGAAGADEFRGPGVDAGCGAPPGTFWRPRRVRICYNGDKGQCQALACKRGRDEV